MRILITGGAGFIGSHLVDYIRSTSQADIIVVDNLSTGREQNISDNAKKSIQLIEDDIQNADFIHEVVESVDLVFHLAAAVGVKHIVENPLNSLKTNIIGTENILDAAAQTGTPTFLASSSEVYGKSTDVPFTETDDRIIGSTNTPRWGYASSKATDEFLALAYYQELDLPVTVGRFFNIVGPRQTGRYGMVVPRFVNQALANEPITVYGDGSQTRSFTHVQDAVEIVYDLMKTEGTRGEVYNIGTPDPITINELAQKIISLTNSTSEIQYIPFAEVYGPNFDEPKHRAPDVSKLKNTLNYAPETDLDQIIRDVIAEQEQLEVSADV